MIILSKPLNIKIRYPGLFTLDGVLTALSKLSTGIRNQHITIGLPQLILTGDYLMPATKLTQFLTLPKLELLDFKSISHSKKVVFECRTTSTSDFCPHCGLETSRVHDTRTVNILDAPHGNRLKKLVLKKKRWRCLGCKKVFTESIPGISKGARVKDITGDKRKLRVRKPVNPLS